MVTAQPKPVQPIRKILPWSAGAAAVYYAHVEFYSQDHVHAAAWWEVQESSCVIHLQHSERYHRAPVSVIPQSATQQRYYAKLIIFAKTWLGSRVNQVGVNEGLVFSVCCCFKRRYLFSKTVFET